ncbi:MAG: response regulator transcription factor [Candidatus Eremiobacteraeota bacterium]|nr:response regulator transcription factor [Candidatus Eremiobacteraeota bacterium]
MKTMKVVLVDDHPLVLQGFKATLDSIDGMEVVGVADNAKTGEEVIEKHNPDVALLDIMLPGNSGLDLMKSLQEKLPDLKVIFITASDSDLYLVEALRYGAAGFLSKDSSKDLIELSIRGALAGGVILAAPLVGKAFGAIAQAAPQVRKPGSASMVDLSTREIDVLRLVAQGKSDNQIRKELNLGEHEIKEYVLTLRKKLGTKDRLTTALQGVRLGLVE